MENTTNKGAVFFATLLPDDYHGYPMLHKVSVDGDFEIPNEDDVFVAWSAAGYNAWNFGENEDNAETWDEDDERHDTEMEEDQIDKEYQCFEDYGNSPIYYAAYIIITNDENYFVEDSEKESSFGQFIEDLGSDDEYKITPKELCVRAKEQCPEILEIIPIQK